MGDELGDTLIGVRTSLTAERPLRTDAFAIDDISAGTGDDRCRRSRRRNSLATVVVGGNLSANGICRTDALIVPNKAAFASDARHGSHHRRFDNDTDAGLVVIGDRIADCPGAENALHQGIAIVAGLRQTARALVLENRATRAWAHFAVDRPGRETELVKRVLEHGDAPGNHPLDLAAINEAAAHRRGRRERQVEFECFARVYGCRFMLAGDGIAGLGAPPRRWP